MARRNGIELQTRPAARCRRSRPRGRPLRARTATPVRSPNCRSHERISAASSRRASPKVSTNSLATSSASSRRSSLSRNELVERLRQREADPKSSRVGSMPGAARSPVRLIQTLLRPSSFAGAMSWNRDAATCTWPSRELPECARRTPPSAGAPACRSRSPVRRRSRRTATPICTWDAAMKSSSVFERIASLHPRLRSSVERAVRLREGAPAGQRLGQSVLVARRARRAVASTPSGPLDS